MTTVSVVDYGADPTGVTDSTAAIAAAYAATKSGDTILFPVVPDGLGYTVGTYLVDPDKSFWVERKFIGERCTNVDTRGPKIKARIAGTSLLNAGAALLYIEGLDFDGDGKVSYAIRLYRSHNTRLEHVSARNATAAAVLFDECGAYASRIVAATSRVGFHFRGANGTSLRDFVALQNQGAGLVVEGLLAGTTSLSGTCQIASGVMEINCQSIDEGQIILNGVDSAIISGIYSEGNSDGVRIINGSHNCVIRDSRFLGDTPHRAVVITKGRGCLFSGCGANISFASARVLSRPDYDFGSYDNAFHHCRKLSSTDVGPWSIVHENSVNNTTSTVTQAIGGNNVGSVPTVGWWRVGDEVSDSRCVVGGHPGSWSSLASISADAALATFESFVVPANSGMASPGATMGPVNESTSCAIDAQEYSDFSEAIGLGLTINGNPRYARAIKALDVSSGTNLQVTTIAGHVRNFTVTAGELVEVQCVSIGTGTDCDRVRVYW